MRFVPKMCPQCHRPAVSIEESVLVEAQLDYDKTTREYGYGGESDVFWDSQESTTDEKDRVLLQCDRGHHWHAKALSLEIRELPAVAEKH